MTANDVEPRMYPMVLREMIRHENDLTNHRIMWLLIAQGLIANAYVGAPGAAHGGATALSSVGILITLSTYFILYKSYHARGYMEFLGQAAKSGVLAESLLPLMGWPTRRAKDWRKNVWACDWLWKGSDLLEPYLFLPAVVTLAWLVVLFGHYLTIDRIWILPLGALGTGALLVPLSMAWVGLQKKDEVEVLPPAPGR
jgi:hypothetical protein